MKAPSDPARRGRPEAAETIWRWRERAGHERERIARLQRHGIVRGAIAVGLGGALLWLDHAMMAGLALTLGVVTLGLAIASPGVGYARMERAVDRLASIVGTVVGFVLLAPVFFLFFVPFRLLARRGRRDRLMRELERERASYWVRRASDEPRLDRPY